VVLGLISLQVPPTFTRKLSRVNRRYAMAMADIGEAVAGTLLVSARGRLGLSQTAFAELIGIAQPTLSAYESGRRQPTLPTLLRLLGQAGLDLRMELSEQDRHDQILAEWERSLDDRERERLQVQGDRLVSGRG
jgi:transcriptional regulator with XRE-family HTH domain